MKKLVFCILLCMLCILSTAAMAVTIKIPATAADAVQLAPAPLPEVPSFTVEDHGDTVQYYFTGLENWPLKYADRYQKGAFQTAFYSKDELGAIDGKEEEPFSIYVSREDTIYTRLEPSSKKYKYLVLDYDLEWRTASFQYQFPKDGTYVLDSAGNIVSYRFKSGKYGVTVDYDALGYPYQIKCFKDGFEARYDASGAFVLLNIWGKQSYTYDGKVWRDEDGETCKKPSRVSEKDIPTLVFTPESNAALIAERAAAATACLPADPTVITGEDMSVFAPLPVLSERTDENGDHIVTVAGLDAWGFSTGCCYLMEENTGCWKYLPTIPEDTIVLNFKPSWQFRKSVQLHGQYKGIEAWIGYREDLQAWDFAYSSGSGDSYCFVLGENPGMLECTYHIDNRIYSRNLLRQTHSEGCFIGDKFIEFIYFNDELVEIEAVQDAGDRPGTVRAFYQPDGTLSILAIEQNPFYEYNAANDEWTSVAYGTREEVVCEQSEGFPLDEWLALPSAVKAALE